MTTALPTTATTETPVTAFCIDSEAAADWLLQQYARIDAEIALLQAQAEAAVKRLKRDREGLEYLYQPQLEQYLRERIAQDKRGRKSLILPHGTCALRTVRLSVRCADPDAALAYARRYCPDLIAETLRQSEYRDRAMTRLKETGEILPGLEITPEKEAFSNRFGKPDEPLPSPTIPK